MQHILDHFDLQAYIEEHISDIVPAAGGTELRVNCFSPHGCNGSDTKHKLYISPSKKQWNCFKCGYGSKEYQPKSTSIFQLMADIEDKPVAIIYYNLMQSAVPAPQDNFVELVEQVLAHKKVLDPTSNMAESQDVKLPSYYVGIHTLTGTSILPYKKYLYKRGMDNISIKQYDVRVCVKKVSKTDYSFSNRIVFPIYDLEGNIASAQGRCISEKVRKDSKPPIRWLTWPGAPVDGCLWPMGTVGPDDKFESAIDQKWFESQTVILVEGIFDVIASNSTGTAYPALATFGKRLSNRQISLLAKLEIKEVILAWDLDAKQAMLGAAKKLSDKGFEVKLLSFDDDFWTHHDIGDLVENPKYWPMYINLFKQAVNFNSPEMLEWVLQ